MQTNFLMGNSDGLRKVPASVLETNTASPGLRSRLLAAAIRKAMTFYGEFFKRSTDGLDYASLAVDYDRHFLEAIQSGLLGLGGVREKDHLHLWCLGKLLRPQYYVESGVFVGSSLHAMLCSGPIGTVVGIDPDLSKLRVPPARLGGVQLVDHKDFSEIELGVLPPVHLAYFDDHINAAKRILQAHAKGFRYLLFDDATGFEGVCQRLNPAIPTIPMVMEPDLLQLGDTLSWTMPMPGRNATDADAFIRVTFEVNADTLALCQEARRLVERVVALPDLGEFIYQQKSERFMDISKYLLKLKG